MKPNSAGRIQLLLIYTWIFDFVASFASNVAISWQQQLETRSHFDRIPTVTVPLLTHIVNKFEPVGVGWRGAVPCLVRSKLNKFEHGWGWGSGALYGDRSEQTHWQTWLKTLCFRNFLAGGNCITDISFACTKLNQTEKSKKSVIFNLPLRSEIA